MLIWTFSKYGPIISKNPKLVFIQGNFIVHIDQYHLTLKYIIYGGVSCEYY
ncbi:hypothetical protein HNQ80_000288 [Anaerosolibacter carboniphilus]|uniref:Uncharacterized protein n=1 Tax=Anaerosolibacter carboniphilus TaxID=1417629 RepID=A0A841KVK1_9FIRM|nr:hypothetical protein [Anaerosolibacter carboniphilus]